MLRMRHVRLMVLYGLHCLMAADLETALVGEAGGGGNGC